MNADQSTPIRPDSLRTLFEVRMDMARLTLPGDPEAAHSRADDLLIEALRIMARYLSADPSLWQREVEELIASFQSIDKWYA